MHLRSTSLAVLGGLSGQLLNAFRHLQMQRCLESFQKVISIIHQLSASSLVSGSKRTIPVVQKIKKKNHNKALKELRDNPTL